MINDLNSFFQTLFPLLIAASVAAPAGLLAATNPLVHQQVAYAAGPAVSYAAAPAVAYAAAPAVTYAHHQVQVPLTKTIHYENKPVVTGYQTTILKPSITTQAFATPIFGQTVVAAPAPAPVAVEAPATVVVSGDLRQCSPVGVYILPGYPENFPTISTNPCKPTFPGFPGQLPAFLAFPGQ